MKRYTLIVVTGGTAVYHLMETNDLVGMVEADPRFNACDVVYIVDGWVEPETYTPRKKKAA